MKSATPKFVLAVVCAGSFCFSPAARAQITGTNQIALTDFDNLVPSWNYGYFYSWGWPSPTPEPGAWTVNVAFNDPLIDPGNGPMCLRFDFTNAPYEQLVATNGGAGYGTGFGGPQIWGFDPSVFNSIDLEDYVVSFDARVEGLEPGMTSASCEMQAQIYDITGQVLQKNLGFAPGSNWTHFSFSLADGSFANGTTAATFTNALGGISDIRFNLNAHMPHAQFGWTDPNAIFIDNLYLGVVQHAGPPPPPPPTVPFNVVDWNMDDKPLWYSFGGYNWSQNANLPTFTYSGAAAGYGVGGSNAWILQMDNSPLAAGPPQWAGGGTGGGGPVNTSQFVTPDLAAYRVSLKAQTAGLSAAKTETTTRLQLFIRAADDTLQPPDPDSDEDVLVRLDYDITAGTNWQDIVYTLKQGVVGLGSKANFSNYLAQIISISMQFQIENAASAADWDYDADNLLAVDDIRIDRLAVGCPPLSIVNNGGTLTVSWDPPSSGTVVLQSAPSVTGTYVEVVGATSPYVIGATNAQRFFRTAWVAP